MILLALQVPAVPQSSIGQANPVAIGCFLLFISITLGITWWAARRTRSTEDFYAAGRRISPIQNGLALAGDYMSAASFLGIAGLVSTTGFDGLIYSTGWLVGWPVVLFLIAEPLRNLGKYTFADVVALNRRPGPVRLAAATGTLATVIFYLIAQMVGAGGLIKLMFGLSYETALIIVGIAMLAYVLFGGMLATTWVQIVKAVLLLSGAFLLAILVLSRFGMNPLTLFSAAAAQYGDGVLSPGKLVANPLDAISLGMALMFGTAGLPHILMRFYTVPDAPSARRSVFYATGLIGAFYLMTFILGFGAMVLVGPDVIKSVDKGGNMAAPLLAELLGGTPFLGFIAAVAFATILAVVAGLTLSGAAALSHDIWVSVVRRGTATQAEQLKVARVATIVLGIIAVLLGITFKGQNVAFMVSLAFAIAASANFPALILTIFWRRMTGSGVVASMVTGTVATLTLIYLSPTVQVDILHHESPIFPLKNPAIITIPLSFLVAIVVSLVTGQHDTESGFDHRETQMHLGH
ncbi:MAG: sodium/solute symporter [Gemmatimonadota bacterium]